MAQEREEAHSGRVAARRAAEELQQRLASIEEERQDILQEARRDAEETLETVRSEVRRIRRRLRAAAAPVEGVAEAEERLASLEKEVLKAKRRKSSRPSEEGERLQEHVGRPIEAGDTVWVRPLNAKGEVLRVDNGEAEVQVGRVRTQVQMAALEAREAEETEPVPEGVQVTAAPAQSPGGSIDFRGQTVDETLVELDHYLDQAMRAGLSQVQIIHGKGTGALRRAVREALGGHPLVKDFEGGDYREGGEGVTVVDLVPR
jgi:DNA mismatch repair protein MutS2